MSNWSHRLICLSSPGRTNSILEKVLTSLRSISLLEILYQRIRSNFTCKKQLKITPKHLIMYKNTNILANQSLSSNKMKNQLDYGVPSHQSGKHVHRFYRVYATHVGKHHSLRHEKKCFSALYNNSALFNIVNLNSHVIVEYCLKGLNRTT